MPTPSVKYVQFLTGTVDPAKNPDYKNDYYFGAAGENWPGSTGTDPATGKADAEWDCSGLVHDARQHAGYNDQRTTADGYKNRATKIAKPERVGDFAVLLRSDGTAHHIGAYVGQQAKGDMIEAMGRAYGLRWGTVASWNARGAVWYRDKKVDSFLNPPRIVPSLPCDARITQDTILWNETIGTKRGVAKRGGTVVMTGHPVDHRGRDGRMTRYMQVTWGGKTGWVMQSHLDWNR